MNTDKMREEFEAEMRDHGWDLTRHPQGADPGYLYAQAQDGWIAWQAAMASAAAAEPVATLRIRHIDYGDYLRQVEGVELTADGRKLGEGTYPLHLRPSVEAVIEAAQLTISRYDRDCILSFRELRAALATQAHQGEQVAVPAGWKIIGNGYSYRSMLAAAPEAPEERKPLTDEQIAEIASAATGWTTPLSAHFELARAIEAAHGVKP